ncbi:NACHT domain-containing protein [Streptomyces sp. H27-C3]|uniref:NACHT domain-containing protein n=1 Tax=Streptomyces sp. H27-C3 TaxID=3046305 RepID=UPI0024BAD2CA|nr:NACHT domain-containing protein [Streptomyces sp. H27-C3]MDJ0466357.1 NACHT domain-containing protein [Streptomyces sp. H27-C3]
MEPATIGARLVSGAVAPLIKKLFVAEGPGAGLVDKPIRLAGYVSFKGEKRTLAQGDLRKLAAELVKQAVRAGERPVPTGEDAAVIDALTATLYAVGDLALSDLDAVRLGHTALARELRRAGGAPERHLSADATYFYERLLDTTCLHILNFFTQRSTFVAATLVTQSRRQGELIAKVDALIARNPLPGAEDVAFEQRYLAHIAKKHSKLTIFGIDLSNSPGKWPLDAAYLSLEATVGALPPLPDWAPLGDAATGLDAAPGPESRRPETRDISWALKSGRMGTHEIEAARSILLALNETSPADQALAAHERVLLRGEAGSGKTTLVQWLAVSAARQDLDDRMAYLHDRVPFVLPLRTLTRHGERLPAPKDFLAAVDCPLAGEQPTGWEARVLTAGRGLVLVDGIDEIPDAERSRTRAWLGELIDTYPGNRWLVTSRPSAVREDWLDDEDFTELTLSPMSRADVSSFIKRWHTAARTGSEDDEALTEYERQLLAAVRAKPDLGRLATSPLLCGLICALHRDRRGFLPLGRKDLYIAALSMLLVRRDRERHMGVPDLREEPQLQLLQRLAYWLIRNGRTVMDRSRAVRIIMDALPGVPELAALGDPKAVFEHFLHRSGLLREPSPGTVDFIHRTFQDFLGARAVVDEGDFGVLVAHAADDQWADVIRMAVAHARPRERAEFFTDLLTYGDAHPDVTVRTRVRLLAAACLQDAAELSPLVRQAVEKGAAALIPPRNAEAARDLAAAGPMILDLLPGPETLDSSTAHDVVVAASHVASDLAIPFLARFCGHKSALVRAQLIWSWARFETGPYAEEVIAHIDPEGLYFTASTDEHLAALGALGARPMLDAKGELSALALRTYTSDASLTHVRIRGNPSLTDVSFLRGQDRLHILSITDCPRLTDLTGIAGLPLRGLTVDLTVHTGISPLTALAGLESLSLYGEGIAWSMTDLPREAPLQSLDLSHLAAPTDGLGELGRYGELESLHLGLGSHPQAPDWAAIGRLTRLSYLETTGDSLLSAPRSLSVPAVTDLSLLGDISSAMLVGVSKLFPNLARLELSSPAPEIDLTPVAALSQLRSIRLFGSPHSVHGLDQLPENVTVYRHG